MYRVWNFLTLFFSPYKYGDRAIHISIDPTWGQRDESQHQAWTRAVSYFHNIHITWSQPGCLCKTRTSLCKLLQIWQTKIKIWYPKFMHSFMQQHSSGNQDPVKCLLGVLLHIIYQQQFDAQLQGKRDGTSTDTD